MFDQDWNFANDGDGNNTVSSDSESVNSSADTAIEPDLLGEGPDVQEWGFINADDDATTAADDDSQSTISDISQGRLPQEQPEQEPATNTQSSNRDEEDEADDEEDGADDEEDEEDDEEDEEEEEQPKDIQASAESLINLQNRCMELKFRAETLTRALEDDESRGEEILWRAHRNYPRSFSWLELRAMRQEINVIGERIQQSKRAEEMLENTLPDIQKMIDQCAVWELKECIREAIVRVGIETRFMNGSSREGSWNVEVTEEWFLDRDTIMRAFELSEANVNRWTLRSEEFLTLIDGPGLYRDLQVTAEERLSGARVELGIKPGHDVAIQWNDADDLLTLKGVFGIVRWENSARSELAQARRSLEFIR